jgi:hypothetical protein
MTASTKTNLHRVGLLLALLALTLVASLVIASQKSHATDLCLTQHHPRDPSWATVCERSKIAVCDADKDGHKTYVDYFPMWSTQVIPSMTQYDSYGTTGGQFCWHERPSDAQGLGMNRFRVCVQYEGCSAWKYYG